MIRKLRVIYLLFFLSVSPCIHAAVLPDNFSKSIDPHALYLMWSSGHAFFQKMLNEWASDQADNAKKVVAKSRSHAGLSCLEFEPTGRKANSAIIWLHGIGSSHDTFLPLAPLLAQGAHYAARFIFPQAPTQPVTMSWGWLMPAWFDIRYRGDYKEEDVHGIQRMAKTIDALIDRELSRGIPVERIVLAGFSQGGAMALHTALYSKHQLAGVIGLSCYLPLSQLISLDKVNLNLPIFLAHGDQDKVVKLTWAQASRKILEKLGLSVYFKLYAKLDHSVSSEEVTAIHGVLKQWLD